MSADAASGAPRSQARSAAWAITAIVKALPGAEWGNRWHEVFAELRRDQKMGEELDGGFILALHDECCDRGHPEIAEALLAAYRVLERERILGRKQRQGATTITECAVQ
jgi:hypothetical protein